MTVLVTGGTGLVGGAIVRALIDEGQSVRVLARPTSQTQSLEALGVEIARGDILQQEGVEAALDGCQTLYHTAALYDLWGFAPQSLMETEREGTRRTLAAAQNAGLKKIVYTSTLVTIGEKKGEIGTENTVHRGYFLSHYEKAKFEAEKIARTYAEKGLPLVIVNPAAVYGPGDFKPTGRTLLSLLNHRMPGLVRGSFSLVFLADAARGHLLAAAKGQTGQRYILCGYRQSVGQIAALVAQVSGARMPPTVPNFAGYLTALSTECIARFTRRPPLLSLETYRYFVHGLQVDGSKAAEELGLCYTSPAEGLRQTFTWYWQQGLLKRKPHCV